jgi:L-threonylcarbamoyladenylate synthase
MEKIISLDPCNFSLALTKAAKVLEDGGLIALPTDTIYGVSSLLEHSEKIYNLKQRPKEKPLGLFVGDSSMVKK